MKKKYIYLVECHIGRNSWLDKYVAICSNADEILPMIKDTGVDSKNAYGEPIEQRISIHSIQKFAQCRDSEQPSSIVHLYVYYCDIKPNDIFH